MPKWLHLPSVFPVVNLAITQSCWAYVVIVGVRIVKGPVEMSDWVLVLEFEVVWFSFGSAVFPSIWVVLVIGGPNVMKIERYIHYELVFQATTCKSNK